MSSAIEADSDDRGVMDTETGGGAAGSGDAEGGAAGESALDGKQTKSVSIKRKGRGFRASGAVDERYSGRTGAYESIQDTKTQGSYQKSCEGWVVFVTGIHEEAEEDDVYDLFSEHGEIKQMQMNLDRRTGYVKGYALVEYGKYSEAEAAVKELNGAELLERNIGVSFAFEKMRRRRRA